jgi:hypothetical protein
MEPHDSLLKDSILSSGSRLMIVNISSLVVITGVSLNFYFVSSQHL